LLDFCAKIAPFEGLDRLDGGRERITIPDLLANTTDAIDRAVRRRHHLTVAGSVLLSSHTNAELPVINTS
jgi:hypothetical protein